MRPPLAGPLILTFALAACDTGGPSLPEGQLFAPDLDPAGEAVDGLIVGHRLMDSREYELALDAYYRAAAAQGLTIDVLSALGAANLALGRLNQAEPLLRQATEHEEAGPAEWNNLGVLLMEKNEFSEASETFRRAFALGNGQNDTVRENLRLALAKLENPVYSEPQEKEFALVRRGQGDFLITASE